MLRKRRKSMKNAKGLMRRSHGKEKSYMTALVRICLVAMLFFASKEGLMSQTNQEQRVRNVVLVHGGWVDGSGWEGVYNALKKGGYEVTVVQIATASLADDGATTKRSIADQTAPLIVVGPS